MRTPSLPPVHLLAAALVLTGCQAYIINDEEGPTPKLVESKIQDPKEPVAPVTSDFFKHSDAFAPAIVDLNRVAFVSNLNDNLDIFYIDFVRGARTGPSPLVATGYDEKNPVLSTPQPAVGKAAKATAGTLGTHAACFFAHSSNETVGIFDVAFPRVQGINQTLDTLTHANWPDISGDRKSMLYSRLDRRGRYVTYHYSFADGTKTFLTEGQRARFNPRDANQFVFTRQGVDGKWDLFMFDIRSGGVSKLTSGEDSFDPCFSPDGKRIAFASNRSGSTDIEVMHLDTSERTRLVTHGSVDCQPVWTPDGRTIVFASNRGGTFDLYMIGLDQEPEPEGAGVKR